MKIQWLKHDEAIITLRWSYFFGLIASRERSYRGDATVWHDAVTGKRQPTNVESALSDIWTAGRWKRDARQEEPGE